MEERGLVSKTRYQKSISAHATDKQRSISLWWSGVLWGTCLHRSASQVQTETNLQVTSRDKALFSTNTFTYYRKSHPRGGQEDMEVTNIIKILLYFRKILCISFSLIHTKIPLKSFIHSFHQLYVTNSWSIPGSTLGGHRKYTMHENLSLHLLLTEGGRH